MIESHFGTVFGGDILLLKNTCGTSPDGYFECGYTKTTSDTCTSLMAIGVLFQVYNK